MMRRHLWLFMACFVLLAVCLSVFPAVVNAAAVDWRIDLNEDGSIEEKLTLPAGQGGMKSGWKLEKQGNNDLYSRVFADWQSYERADERLPIKVDQKNYILYKAVQISADPNHAKAFLIGPEATKGFKLVLRTSGIIKESSGQQSGESTITWNYDNKAGLLQETKMVSMIMIDGFLTGISILAVGLVGVFIFFVSRLRKVDRIIQELYSLDNIQLDDLDEVEPQ